MRLLAKFFFFNARGIIVDWSRVDGGSSNQDANPKLPNGSKLIVAAATTPKTLMSMNGTLEEALQVSFWIVHPAHAAPVDVVDEWISMSHGDVVRLEKRVFYRDTSGTDVYGPTDYTSRNRPAILFSTALWNRPIHAGMTFQLRFPGGFITPVTSDLTTPMEGNISYTLTEVAATNAGCNYTFRIDITGAILHVGSHATVEVEATWNEMTSLPIRLRQTLSKSEHRLVLTANKPGEGPALAPLVPHEVGPSALESSPSRDGFLGYAKPVFPTNFSDAMAAIRSDPTAGSWLQQHPHAKPFVVKHRLGKPGGDIISAWRVQWAAEPNGGDGQETVAQFERPVSFLTPRWTVQTSPVQNAEYPPSKEPMVTLEGLDALYRHLWNRPPETLDCFMAKRFCDIGTHESTKFPYQGESGAWVNYAQGAKVWIDNGSLLLETFYDSKGLRPPVPIT